MLVASLLAAPVAIALWRITLRLRSP
jgi:hypothetical protein